MCKGKLKDVGSRPMARRQEKRLRLEPGEFWCPSCETTVYAGYDLCAPDGTVIEADQVEEFKEVTDLCCLQCSGIVHGWVEGGDKSKALAMRWLEECKRKNLIGPSPGGAAGQLQVSRARIYSMVEEGILERTDCDVEGYQMTFISQRSINARKKQIEAMRAAGNKPEAGGKPWHKR